VNVLTWVNRSIAVSASASLATAVLVGLPGNVDVATANAAEPTSQEKNPQPPDAGISSLVEIASTSCDANESTVGSQKVVTFTTPTEGSTCTATWTVPAGVTEVDYLIVAGGGGGGGRLGGGGGAGGLLEKLNHPVTPSSDVNITVGAGGAGGLYNTATSSGAGEEGGNSVAFGVTAFGGGGGGQTSGAAYATQGGSGGGSGGNISGDRGEYRSFPGSLALDLNPVQGSKGGAARRYGDSNPDPRSAGGGGGGAGGPGGDAVLADDEPAGAGGPGLSSTIVAGTFASGGDGATYSEAAAPEPGEPSTGDGGDGGDNDQNGGSGGSGIVVIRYVAPPEVASLKVTAADGSPLGTQTAGQPFDIRVVAKDSEGQTVTGFQGTVDISSDNTTISSGDGTTANFTNGVLSSHSVTVTTAGASKTLTASNPSEGSGTGTSAAFTVNPGSASLTTSTVTASPTSIEADGSTTSQITVQLRDQYSNSLMSSGGTVVVSTDLGSVGSTTDNGDGTYSDTLTSGTVSGTATVSATLNGSLLSDTAIVTFDPGAVTQILVSTQPVAGASGSVLSTQPIVRLADANGNTVTSDSSTDVTVSVSGGSGSLTGTKTVQAVNGEVAFAGLAFAGLVGTDYRLTFTATGVTSAESDPISPTGVGPASVLVITTPAGDTTYGSTFDPQPVITVRDSGGNTVESYSTAVTATVTSGGVTVETGTATPTAGVATFVGLGADAPAGTVTVEYTSSTLTGASETVEVAKAPQAALNVTSTPSTIRQGQTASLSTSGGSGAGGVTYVVTSGNCSITGTTVTANAASGSCVITATKAADDNYLEQTGTTTITLSPPPTITIVASGGDPQGSGWTLSNGIITATADVSIDESEIEAALNSADLTIDNSAGSGAVTVASGASIDFSSAHTLTFKGDTLTNDGIIRLTDPGSTVVFEGIAPNDNSGTLENSGTIEAGGLLVKNLHMMMLTSSGDVDVNTVASVGGHRLVLVDTDALTIGTVAGIDGISATEWVVISTETGDLTVDETVTTSASSSGMRLRLSAGTNSAFGDAAGGDVIIGTGTISAPNAVTQIFSGTAAGSTGVTSIATAEAVATVAPVVSVGQVAVAYRAGPPTFTSADAMRYNQTLTLAATDPASGSVTFSEVSGPCTVTGSTVTPTGVGSCVVRATGPGPSNLTTDDTITISQAGQTILFTSQPPLSPRALGTYAVSASATSGLPVTLSIAAGSSSVCSFVPPLDDTVIFDAAGTCVIIATQPGDSNFTAATSVTQSIVVGKLNQSISFTQPTDRGFGDPAFALSATASSGLAVVFSRDDTATTNNACTVDDTGIVTIDAVGDCAITTNQAGNDVFAPASAVTKVFTVDPVPASAPFITSVNVQNGESTITLNGPGFAGGAALSGYQINAYPASGGPPIVFTGCPTTFPVECTIPGLVDGESYRFTVQAINSAGAGAESPLVPAIEADPIISIQRPKAVSQLAARKGDTQLTVTWDPLSLTQLGGGGFTRYDLRLEQSADDSEIATTTLTDRTDDSYVFTGLTNGTAYTVTVVAITTNDDTEYVGNTAIVSEIPARAPDPVVGTYLPTSGTTGIVSWAPPVSDGGSAVTEYRVVLTSEGVTAFDDTVGPGVFSLPVSGLTRGATYDVTVTVKNGADPDGTDDTQEIRQPDRPAPPVITNATPVTVDDSTAFEVTWNAPADNGAPITGYQVTATKRSALGTASMPSTSVSLIGPASVDDTQFTCTSSTTECMMFAPGSVRDYAFVVVADNLAGTSPQSAPFVVPDPTPPTPVAPTPPLGVRAWAMQGAAMVTWAPPASAGSFAVSMYRVTSAPGGVTCLAPARQLWCEVNGLRNGRSYTFTVTALTGAGWGAPSAPSNAVTPSRNPEPGPAPDPQPVPGPVAPGTVAIDLDGGSAPGATGGPNPARDGMVVSGPDFAMDIVTLTAGGAREPLAANGELRVKTTGRIRVTGDGALPGSTMAVYAIPATVVAQTRNAAEPILVGRVVAGDSGTYAGSWAVALQAGDYLVQVVATPGAGGVLAASTPIRVTLDDARTILLDGTRAGDGAGKRVNVRGTTTNLEGATVQARVKLAGESRYRSGSTRVVVDEAFTWTRIANRKVYVYFQTVLESGEKVRSTRITIPGRSG